MFTLRDLWAGFALPLVLTAATWAVSWYVMRRRMTARDSRSWAGPLAVGIGFAGGYGSLFGWPGFPPLDVSEWLFFLTLPLVALATLDSLFHIGLPGTLITAVAASGFAVSLLCWPLVKGHDNLQGDMVLESLVVVGLLVGWIMAMDALAARLSAARLSATLLAATAPAAIALGLSGSQRLAQTCGVLAATQAGTLAAHWALGHAGVGRGTVLVVGVLYAGLLLCGNLYAELTTANALLLFAAPNAAWLALGIGRRLHGWKHTAVQIALVAAVALWALMRAIIDFRAESAVF